MPKYRVEAIERFNVRTTYRDVEAENAEEAMRQRGWQFTALNPVELYY